VYSLAVLTETSLVGEAASANITHKRLEARVALLMCQLTFLTLEGFGAHRARMWRLGLVDYFVRIQRGVRLERLSTHLAIKLALIAVNGIMRLQVAFIHERMATDIAYKSGAVVRVPPLMRLEQHLGLVHLVAYITHIVLAFYVRAFVSLQRAVIDEAFTTKSTEERAISRVQHHVHLEAVLVRERLVTYDTLEPLGGAVHGLNVALEMRVRQVGFGTEVALVWTDAFMLEDVKLEAVVKAERLVTLAMVALVWLNAAVHSSLVMIQRALSRELLTTYITMEFIAFFVSVEMLPQG
jgi:hypothetical protein